MATEANSGARNLIPPVKGEIRNPRGKPKGTKDLATLIRKISSQEIDWDKINIRDTAGLQKRYGKGKVAEAMIWVMVSKALTGDVPAFNSLAAAGWGKTVYLGGHAQLDVVHIYRPEKLPAGYESGDIGAQLRQRAEDAIEGELADEDGLETEPRTAGVRTPTTMGH